MSEQTLILDTDLAARFPEAVTPDERKGFEGYLVKPESLLEVVSVVRDELGYDYLSSVTGVDNYPDNLEVVYHLYKTTGGPGLMLKTQVPRDQASVPSLVPLYPGADFQEREAWDLLGIRFEGHPDLRRILLWEGFEGHPLRKDWREPYFEEESKPFKSRWPEGSISRSETKNLFGKNVDYPTSFDPDTWVPDGDAVLYASLNRFSSSSDSAAASFDPWRISRGSGSGWRNHPGIETGNGLPAPQSRKNWRAQHLPAKHAFHRSPGLPVLDEQQFRLRPGS
jgi:NADH-quinone oxidoreductase subunit C/D